MRERFSKNISLMIGVILGIIILIIDLNLEYGRSVWILYIIPFIFLAWRFPRNYIISFAVFYSFLVLIKYAIYPGAIPNFSIFNRSVFIAALFSVAFLLYQKSSVKNALVNASNALRLERSQFQAILDNAPLLISMKDREGRIIMANEQVYKTLNITDVKDFLGKSIFEVFPREIAEALWENDLSAIREKKPVTAEEKVRLPDGKWLTYLTTKFPVYYLGTDDLIGICAISTDITDRKEYEEKIKESEERFRLIAGGLPLFIWSADPEGRVDFIGGQWQEFSHGIRQEEGGWTWISALHPEDRQQVMNLLEKCLKTGEDYKVIYRLQNNDGQFRWRFSHASAMRDETGRIIKWYGTSYDIHEQRMLEERLNKALIEAKGNQIRFERAEHLAQVGSWVNRSNSDLIEISEELNRILGFNPPRKEIPVSEYIQMIHPDDYERFIKSYKESRMNNGMLDIEYRIIRPDGQIRHIHGISGPETNEKGESVTRYGAAKDITDHKTTELEMKRIQEDLKEAQKLAHIGSFTVYYKDNGRVEWSEEMFRIFERDPEAGNPTLEEIFAAIHPEDREIVGGIIQKAVEEKRKSETDFRIVISGYKTKYLHNIFSPVYEPSGEITHLFGTSLDVTETMKQRQKMEEALLRLERSNKELEQFAYVASHDLQEPLRMVSTYMGLLRQRYADRLDHRANMFIEYAVEGAKRMSALIMDLLVFSRITSQAKEFESTDLNLVFNDVLSDLQVLIREKEARIISSELPTVSCDSVQIRQLFQNLIANGLKFNNSSVPQVSISAVKTGKKWTFSVADNGIGIEADYYERIFQIFQRLHDKEKYPGTGIGLAICRKIVERHGGKIWVESEPGKGSTFFFTLYE